MSRLAAFIFSMLLVSLPVVAETLPEAMRLVLQQHPEIRAGQAQLNISNERLLQARSNFYPTLGLDGTASDARDIDQGNPRDRTTRRADVFLRWNLFRGFADRQGQRAAEHDQLAADAGLLDAREQVALQLVQAYLDVLRLRRQLALGETYISEHQRLSETVKMRVKNGRVAAADQEQVRATLIQARLQQSQIRAELRSVEAFYGLLVGRPAGELSEPTLDVATVSQDLEGLLQQVQLANPQVRSALQTAAARAEEVGVAAAALSPSFDLELRKRLLTEIDPIPQTDARQSAQIQFSYQMPLGGASFSRKREAVQLKLQAQATADAKLLRVRGEIAQRWSTWQEARAIAVELAERVEASDRVVQAYDLQFAAARRSTNDLIVARADRYRAASDQLENRIQQLSSSAQVLSLLGLLESSVLGEKAVEQP